MIHIQLHFACENLYAYIHQAMELYNTITVSLLYAQVTKKGLKAIKKKYYSKDEQLATYKKQLDEYILYTKKIYQTLKKLNEAIRVEDIEI